MYISTAISTLLALGLVASKPLPNSTPESATVVDVTSASYSSLIVFNPAAAPTSSGSSSDAFLTPSGVVLPQASATLSLQGNLPSVSESSTQASQSGVRVVGQGSSALESGTGNGTSDGGGDTEAVKENAATTMAVSGWMFVGVGSALVAVIA